MDVSKETEYDPWSLLQELRKSGTLSTTETNDTATNVMERPVGPATLHSLAELQLELGELRAQLVEQQVENCTLRKDREQLFELLTLRDNTSDQSEYVSHLEDLVRQLQDDLLAVKLQRPLLGYNDTSSEAGQWNEQTPKHNSITMEPHTTPEENQHEEAIETQLPHENNGYHQHDAVSHTGSQISKLNIVSRHHNHQHLHVSPRLSATSRIPIAHSHNDTHDISPLDGFDPSNESIVSDYGRSRTYSNDNFTSISQAGVTTAPQFDGRRNDHQSRNRLNSNGTQNSPSINPATGWVGPDVEHPDIKYRPRGETGPTGVSKAGSQHDNEKPNFISATRRGSFFRDSAFHVKNTHSRRQQDEHKRLIGKQKVMERSIRSSLPHYRNAPVYDRLSVPESFTYGADESYHPGETMNMDELNPSIVGASKAGRIHIPPNVRKASAGAPLHMKPHITVNL